MGGVRERLAMDEGEGRDSRNGFQQGLSGLQRMERVDGKTEVLRKYGSGSVDDDDDD